ncbi:flagellar filament capping protein FliD [Erythrobacter sp. SCSIO 43205]|uniref:flagellar filament capping protein FliD n=1 Tax=Erythrobacter sp. SCSIO 43205 TaxID=2779361 RepID=UPI001CA99060|nr:flagellar filament capping protein FliD [Erythrobacter sp. SCSIO 43205]UAB78752.1 flagellar filament capping protein FliD [Erythrobacter sp. SCSIO 43205]
MENQGSSIIQALGAGSGINFTQLASDLSQATFDPQRANINSRNETLTARISAASVLRSTLNDLASALGDRVRNGDLSPSPSLTNPSIADITTTSGVAPQGTYSLEVSQLASGQTLASQSFASGSDLVGAGTLNIRFGTVSGSSFAEDTEQTALAIDVTDTDTLASLASKITGQSDGKLFAYVAEGSNGAQLVIKGDDGATNGFVLEPTGGSGAGGPGDLGYLTWDPASDAGELRQSAQDAIFELDTVEITSSSNTVTGLPEGLTLELRETNVGEPATLTFETNTGAISAVMGDLVAALNDVVGLLAEASSGVGAALTNDQGARELRRDLSGLASRTVMPSASGDEPATLGDLGLKITREGRFEFDSARLDATLTRSPEGAAAMFTAGAFGVFATIDKLARDNTLSTDSGSLGGSVARYQAQIERNDERLADIAEDQERLRNRLTRSFVSAQSRVASSQSTLSFLQQQIDAFSQSN